MHNTKQTARICLFLGTHDLPYAASTPPDFSRETQHQIFLTFRTHGGGRLTGAERVRGVAVSAVETILARTNIGSSSAGATVGWAGSTGSLPKFGFEGPRDAGWMSGRENQRDNKNKTTKAHCTAANLQDKQLPHLSQDKAS